MDTERAYDLWALQYDSNENRTRDLEARSLRECLSPISFSSCLEIGCGTGKNSVWLADRTSRLTSVDLSAEMLARAREKINSNHVQFVQADINQDWLFARSTYDLVSFSLVLEHIENLEHVFSQTSTALADVGFVYIGELHPYKQYTGTKARFENGEGLQVLQCFDHHVSDFIGIAKKYDLRLLDLNEYFDDDKKQNLPRILTLLFRKS